MRHVGAPTQYRISASLDEELPRIKFAANEAQKLSRRLTADLREGRKLSIEEISTAVEPVVASVIRNPDAYFWLASLKERDPYAYSHAVNCAALMSAFGRQLGFPGSVLVELASAGMLMDLGMASLPEGTTADTITLEQAVELLAAAFPGVKIYATARTFRWAAGGAGWMAARDSIADVMITLTCCLLCHRAHHPGRPPPSRPRAPTASPSRAARPASTSGPAC